MFWQIGGAVDTTAPAGRAPTAHPVEPGLFTWGYVLYEIRPRPHMSEYP